MDALADGSNLNPPLIEEFLEELTGEPLTSTVEDLSCLTAKGIAAVINALKTKPVIKGKLFAQCRWLAEHLGGEVAYTFTLSGLHGEPIAAPPPPSPALSVGGRRYSRSRSRTRTPKEPSRIMMKFNGVTQQGGQGADNEFEVMSEAYCCDLIREYEDNVLGGKIPEHEKPSPTQLSAIRAKLMMDKNPAADHAKFGPYGDRAALIASRIEDVIIDGTTHKRRVTGPTTFAEWCPCWRVWGNCLKILKASTPGPLDEYEKLQKELDQQNPGKYSILAQADFICRFERWGHYRDEINEMLRRGNPHLSTRIPWCGLQSFVWPQTTTSTGLTTSRSHAGVAT